MKQPLLEKVVIFLLVFASFEGYIRRHIVPAYHGYLLVFKDLVIVFIYFLFIFKGSFCKKFLSFWSSFIFILWIYFIWNVIKINSPYGLLVGLIGFKSNLLYLPLLFIGYYIAYKPNFYLYNFLYKTSWPIFIVFLYAIFQILTGYDTCITDNELGIAGGYVRNIGILTVASTLYGGLLAPYGLIWFIIIFFSLLSISENKKYQKYFYVLSFVSFFIILLGNNRTTLVALTLVFSVLFLTFFYYRAFNLKIFWWLIVLIFLFYFFVYILKISPFLTFSGWLVFIKNIFNPTSRASVTINFIYGLKNVFKIGKFLGIGLGSLTQGTYYLGVHIDVTKYGLFGTESIVHRMIIELGIVGLLFYISIFLWLIFKIFYLFYLARHVSKSFSYIPLAALNLLWTYLLLSYKHHGFATNATIQLYTFLFIGIFIGITQKEIEKSLNSYSPKAKNDIF